jgi:Iap family predicted aminopeptidase
MTLYQLLKALDHERLAGTDGERRGRETIISYLQGLGLQPRTEAFEINGFESGTANVSVGDKSWEATPYGLCGDCDVEGELVFLENADALLLNPGRYDGRIVLYYHSDRRLYDLAAQAKVKAFIGISSPLKTAYSYSHRQNLPAEEIFPSAMLRYDYAEKLMHFSGKKARLRIKQDAGKRMAHNIVLDIPGKGRDTALTLLVGHYDSVARSNGACDNAAGSVCMLKAAEYFAKKQPERDLRIIWFSGEELGLLGSFAYANAHEDEMKQRVKLVLNVDLAGDPIGRNVMFVLGTKELQGYAGGILRENGLIFSENLNIYSSDCMPFSVLEIPSLNLARVGGKGLFHCHTDNDKARNASEYGLKDVYLATQAILDRVLNARMYPVPSGIDDTLREKIERYLWHSTLQKPELKWKEKYRK